jgi:hypothetical protein
MIPGKSYIVKYRIIGIPNFIFHVKGVFKEMIVRYEFDHFTQRRITETYIVLLHSADPWRGMYEHSYNMKDVLYWYNTPRFSPREKAELIARVRIRERRNLQRGLIGKFPYDIARLIASYI